MESPLDCPRFSGGYGWQAEGEGSLLLFGAQR